MHIAPERAVAQAIAKRGKVLLLDFDGTLSPIVAHADDARISDAAKQALRILVRHIPIAVVSGRPIARVRSLVGVRGLSYAGSHGFETLIAGHYECHVPSRMKAVFRGVRAALEPLVAKYPGAYIEDKKFGVAVHYRSVTPRLERALRREAAHVVDRFVRDGSVRVHDDTKTFDVYPAGSASKGSAVRSLVRSLGRGGRPLVVYIGDSMTDEDAFRALSSGLTIRVGYKKGSAARYHFRNREEVDEFLGLLAQEIKIEKSI